MVLDPMDSQIFRTMEGSACSRALLKSTYRIFWNEDSFDLTQLFIVFEHIFLNKTATRLTSSAVVAFLMLVVQLNFRNVYKNRPI